MKNNFRSGCPIASTLDIVGDKWSLLLIRDMLIYHKKSFKEFSESKEQIAPSILSARLKILVEYGLLSKHKLTDNKKENVYLLSEKGIGLSSILLDLTIWGDKNLREFNEIDTIEGLEMDKSMIIAKVNSDYLKMIEKLDIE